MKFSLGTLIAVVSAFAVYFGIVFGMSPIVGSIAMGVVSVLMGPVVVVGLVYGRGYARTFWIGCATTALVPYIWLLYFSAFYSMYLSGSNPFGRGRNNQVTYTFVICHLMILFSGFAAIAARRWLVERERPQPTPTGTAQTQAPVEGASSPFRES